MERCSGHKSPGLSPIAVCKGLQQGPRGAIFHLSLKSNPSQDWPRVSGAKSYLGTIFPCSQARIGVAYLEPGTSAFLSQCQPPRLPSSACSPEPWPNREMLSRNLTKHGPDGEGSSIWVPEQTHLPSPSLYHPSGWLHTRQLKEAPGGYLAHQGLRGPQKRCQVHEACQDLGSG